MVRKNKSEEKEIQSLIKRLVDEDPEVNFRVAEELVNRGEKALPLLIDALKNEKDWHIRYEITDVFWQMQKITDEMVFALIDALDDISGGVRYGAAYALATIGKNSEQVIPALMKKLREETDGLVCFTIIFALGMYGEKAKESVPLLLDVLKVEKKHMRKQAIQSLVKIDASTHTLSILKKQLSKEKAIDIQFDLAMAITKIERKQGVGTKKIEEMKMKGELSKKFVEQYDDLCQELALDKEVKVLSETVEKLPIDKPLSTEDKRTLQETTKTIEDKMKTLFERKIDEELAKYDPPSIEQLNALYSLGKTRVETVSTIEDIKLKKAQAELALLDIEKRKALIEIDKTEKLANIELKRAEIAIKRTAVQRFLIENGLVLLNILFTAFVGILAAVLVFKK